MRVLVCGSRTWDDYDLVELILNALEHQHGVWNDRIEVIEGGARGADACAAKWIQGWDVDIKPKHYQFPADWDRDGKRAGPLRNKRMLQEGKPDMVVAFSEHPLTTGTAHMVKLAKEAGVPTYVVSHA